MDWEKKGGNMVIFNALEESLRELELDKDAIDCEIVRVTALYQQSQTVPLRYLYVVTTYKVKGELVKFQEHVGDVWGLNNRQDKATRQRVVDLSNRIEAECQKLGLEVRAGMYKEGGES
jgi:hypothetical protein